MKLYVGIARDGRPEQNKIFYFMKFSEEFELIIFFGQILKSDQGLVLNIIWCNKCMAINSALLRWQMEILCPRINWRSLVSVLIWVSDFYSSIQDKIFKQKIEDLSFQRFFHADSLKNMVRHQKLNIRSEKFLTLIVIHHCPNKTIIP